MSIRILAIDPGINHLGWSVHEYDQDKDQDQIVEVGQIDATKIAHKFNKQDFKTYGNVFSLHILEKEIRSLLQRIQPQEVCCEGAFMARFPLAFASLKLCINVIQQVLYLDYKLQLNLIAPKEAKKAVFKGTAVKDEVQTAIRKIKGLQIPKDLELTEHQADSIAIGYAYITLNHKK